MILDVSECQTNIGLLRQWLLKTQTYKQHTTFIITRIIVESKLRIEKILFKEFIPPLQIEHPFYGIFALEFHISPRL